MKMDYRRDLQHNYLVVETGEDTENYVTRMMTENQVQGLLSCECRRMDQKKLYYYDITSKISLAEKCRFKKVKGEEALLVIQGLLQVLVQLEEYLIPADQICLDWNCIYLDPTNSQPSFCCLPVAEKELEQGIRELLEELLPRLDHQEQVGVAVVYELYQYAIQDTFSVMELQAILERRMTEQRKMPGKERVMSHEEENRQYKESGYTVLQGQQSSYSENDRSFIQKEQSASWDGKQRTGHGQSDNKNEQFWADRRSHERALEDFFSVDEEDTETDREKHFPVWLVLGILGVALYVSVGYAVWMYFPEYLGTWAALGVIVALSILIWQVVVKRKKKEESQIEEQFAVYQEKIPRTLGMAMTDTEEYGEREDEFEGEEVQDWGKRISRGDNNYTQILSNGRKQGGLTLRELHPVAGRQFMVEGSHSTIIGQLREQADLVLPSAAVSRVHASIEQRAGNWYLKDLNSRNGTWVNDQELYGEEEKELINGDQVRFADLVYQVEV